MSYSLNADCGNCLKFDRCIDYHVIRGAVDIIHMIGPMKNHLGSGSIDLKCQAYETRNPGSVESKNG